MKVLVVSSGSTVDRGATHLVAYVAGLTASSREFNLPQAEDMRRGERFSSMLGEARARADLGVGELWTPASSNTRRPSSIACRNAISLPTFATECEALAATHPSVRRPCLHFVMALENSEDVPDKKLVEAAAFVTREIGLIEHLSLTSVHRDTDTVHCHVAASAVNPITHKTFRTPSVKRIAFVVRKAEIAFGLRPGRGQQTTIAGGIIRFTTAVERSEWRREQAISRRRSRQQTREDRERIAAIQRLRDTDRAHTAERERGLDRGDRGHELER